MKNENYDDLMGRFFAGKASAEEIEILKRAGLPDEQDILYAALLNSVREQKMDWEFEDFMKEIPATKTVAFATRSVWMKRITGAAAAVAIIVAAYLFWPHQNNPSQVARVPTINEPGSNPDITVRPVSPVHKLKDSGLSSGVAKTNAGAIAAKPVKNRKQKLPKSSKAPAKELEEALATHLDFVVMVNGKTITDEEDAMAIMKESISMVSENLAYTVNVLKPIAHLKLKL